MATRAYDHGESRRGGERDDGPESGRKGETGGKARIPGYVYFVGAVAALGGLLFGYDTGVISGAELFLQKSFHLNSTGEEILVSAVLVGAIIGAAIGGKLSDRIGRKITLIVMAIVFAIGAILTSLAPNPVLFAVFRVVVGIGIGASSVVAPMYTAELAPPSIRGVLVFLFQLAITIGIAVAYWVDLGFSNAGMGWRPMFAVAIIPAAILGIGMLFLSDTPRWLASKGRWDEAQEVLNRVAPTETKKQMDEIRTRLEEEKRSKASELFRGGLRVALIVGVGLAILQQFVGINTIIYYAPTIFGYAGFKAASGAILATSVVGVVNVLATIVSIFLVDRVGRRALLLVGIGGLTLALVAVGLLFAIGPQHAGVILLICMLLYIIFFAIGLGPVYWLLSAELFPTRLRGLGASLSTVGNWSANLLVSVTFLSLIQALGKPLTFWVYAVFGVIAFAFTLFLVPETKSRNLEEIEDYWEHDRHWDQAA